MAILVLPWDETMRIFQNTQQLINNKIRTAIDNRLPQHEASTHNIISEALSHTIPALASPTFREGTIGEHCRVKLWFTAGFSHVDFQWLVPGMNSKISCEKPHHDSLRKTLGLASNSTTNTTTREFWISKTSSWSIRQRVLEKKVELIERFEFQLRGAIHSRWCVSGFGTIIRRYR